MTDNYEKTWGIKCSKYLKKNHYYLVSNSNLDLVSRTAFLDSRKLVGPKSSLTFIVA